MTEASKRLPKKVAWNRLRRAYGWGWVAWAGVLLVVALVWLAMGLRLGARGHDPLGSRFFPVAVSSLLALAVVAVLLSPLARLLVGRDVTSHEQTNGAVDEVDGLADRSAIRASAMIAVAVGYVALLGLIGYVPATILGLMACMYLLGSQGAPGLVIMPVVTAVLLYLLFTYGLFVRLP